MYGGFVTLLMLAGIVVIIALIPSMSKSLLLKNMGDISYQTAKSFSLERIIKEWKSLFIKIYEKLF